MFGRPVEEMTMSKGRRRVCYDLTMRRVAVVGLAGLVFAACLARRYETTDTGIIDLCIGRNDSLPEGSYWVSVAFWDSANYLIEVVDEGCTLDYDGERVLDVDAWTTRIYETDNREVASGDWFTVDCGTVEGLSDGQLLIAAGRGSGQVLLPLEEGRWCASDEE